MYLQLDAKPLSKLAMIHQRTVVSITSRFLRQTSCVGIDETGRVER